MTLTEYFGATPRVRILEAVLRLAPLESFTMKDVANEADLFPPSTYRTIRRLVDEGFLEVAERGRPERFRVPSAHPDVQLLSFIDAAITHLRNPIQMRSSDIVVDQFRKLSGAIVRSEITTNSSSQRVDVSKGTLRQKGTAVA